MRSKKSRTLRIPPGSALERLSKSPAAKVDQRTFTGRLADVVERYELLMSGAEFAPAVIATTAMGLERIGRFDASRPMAARAALMAELTEAGEIATAKAIARLALPDLIALVERAEALQHAE